MTLGETIGFFTAIFILWLAVMGVVSMVKEFGGMNPRKDQNWKVFGQAQVVCGKSSDPTSLIIPPTRLTETWWCKEKNGDSYFLKRYTNEDFTDPFHLKPHTKT